MNEKGLTDYKKGLYWMKKSPDWMKKGLGWMKKGPDWIKRALTWLQEAMEKLLPKTETKYLSTLFSFFNKKRKPETDVCISGHSLFEKCTSSHFSHVEISTRAYGKTSSPQQSTFLSHHGVLWPKDTLHFMENMRPTFLFVRIALLHDAKPLKKAKKDC